MSAGSVPSTLKEAYCSRYGCSPDQFENELFWKCLYRHAVIPAWMPWLVYRSFFRYDLEFIRAFGVSRNTREFMMATGEFASRNKNDRNFIRKTFKIRVSGERLTRFHNELSRLLPVEDRAAEKPFQPVPVKPERPRPGVAPQPLGGDAGRGETQAVILRRLRTAHEDICQGRNLEDVIAQSGVTEDQLLSQLETNTHGNPHYEWLRRYILNDRRLRFLEVENERLSRKVASQSMEMDDIKQNQSVR